MDEKLLNNSLTRRSMLGSVGTLVLSGTGLYFTEILAASELKQSTSNLFDSNALEDSSRIKIHMPEYAYDGGRVPFSIEVESRMTETDYVSHVHVFSESNPFPRVASFHLTPHSGRAFARTRIRLSTSQHVIVVAEMHNGNTLTARKWIEVTINGCKED